jgi:DNA-binding LacI/PurR family transcriptional regulator
MPKTFLRVADELKERIGSGFYGAGEPLPSERTLEEEFAIHRTTVRRALNVLIRDGLLTRSPGHRAYTRPASRSNPSIIGLFAGDRHDPFARSIILQGMNDAIEESHPALSALAASALDFSPAVREGPSGRQALAGAVLLPPRTPDLQHLRQIRRDMPIVLLDRMVPGFEADFIGFQDFEAGYAAARHLYEVGHRRIAFLGSVVPETADQRSLGVEAFCREAGIEQTWNFCAFSAGRDVPEGYVNSLFHLARETWPTGAVCTNDETAAFMISCLGRMGLRVPGDLALVGMGNAQTALLNALGLTTMAQPYSEVGRQAMNLIARRLDGTYSGEPAEIRLPMQLLVRSSCGASKPTIAA